MNDKNYPWCCLSWLSYKVKILLIFTSSIGPSVQTLLSKQSSPGALKQCCSQQGRLSPLVGSYLCLQKQWCIVFVIMEGVGTVWKLRYNLPTGLSLVTLESPDCRVPHRDEVIFLWPKLRLQTEKWCLQGIHVMSYTRQLLFFWGLQSAYTQILKSFKCHDSCDRRVVDTVLLLGTSLLSWGFFQQPQQNCQKYRKAGLIRVDRYQGKLLAVSEGPLSGIIFFCNVQALISLLVFISSLPTAGIRKVKFYAT